MEIALLIGQLLLKFGPDIAREFTLLLHHEAPKQEDWDKLFELAKEPWKDRA